MLELQFAALVHIQINARADHQPPHLLADSLDRVLLFFIVIFNFGIEFIYALIIPYNFFTDSFYCSLIFFVNLSY